MNTLTVPRKSWPTRQPVLFLILAALAWLTLYNTLIPASEGLVAALPVDQFDRLMSKAFGLNKLVMK